jgi:hypothetical protein
MQSRVYHTAFEKKVVDVFYDIVDLLVDLVFKRQINPYTGKPYFLNPMIENVFLYPNTEVDEHEKYEFTVLHEVSTTLASLTTTAIWRMKVLIKYPVHGKAYTNLHVIDSDIQDTEKKFRFDYSSTTVHNRKDLFEIWLSIPRYILTINLMNETYETNRNYYLRKITAIEHFCQSIMPSVALAYTKRLAPTNTWTREVLGNPYIVEMIYNELYKEMKAKVMKKIFI